MPEDPKTRLTVDKADRGLRLDKFLALAFPDHSRSFLQKLIADGCVTVNGQAVKQSHELAAGEAVEVVFPPPAAEGIEPEDIPLEIIHQDADLVVVNKPPGMVV
ncbi:MAG: RNA pseudouridine synthase, partial [Planctomycetes bacterium]|nr:RNA pseudouridine synthase [Planctomycetota bacterium]